MAGGKSSRPRGGSRVAIYDTTLRDGTQAVGVSLSLEDKLLATKKLDDLEKRARAFRRDAEEYLLFEDTEKIRKDSLHLFYPTEESEEFE